MLRVDQTLLQQVILSRQSDSYKGDYGRLLLIGGTYPYGGAIIMAALAAVHSGAGLVTVATDRENIPSLHSQLPEAMAFAVTDQELLVEQIAKAGVILLGPGLNANELGGHLVELVFERVQTSSSAHSRWVGPLALYSLRTFSSSSSTGLYSSSKRMGGHVRASNRRSRGRSNKAVSVPTSSSKYSGPKGSPDQDLATRASRLLPTIGWRPLSSNGWYGRYFSRHDCRFCGTISTSWSL